MGPEPVVDRSVALDVGLAIVLAGLGIAEVLVPFSTVIGGGSPGLGVALVLCSCLPLALRRRVPVPVLLVVILPAAVAGLFNDVSVLFWGGLVPTAVAVYSVARHGRGPERYIAPVVAVGALAFLAVGNEAIRSPSQLFFPLLVLLVSGATGLTIGRKHRVAVASARRAALVEERSREETLLAIAEERSRIARELHDVVAHAVTAMVVQAGAAGQVVEEDPDYARAALDGIRTTGSRALQEMRQVVSMLRDADEDTALTPQPGVSDLPALVAASSTLHTQVHLDISGSAPPLTAGQELAIYRIVQEALTNAHRHAQASAITVSLSYEPEAVLVVVGDDGVGQAKGTSGHGLIGMRERAAAHGGRVEFASREGFLVHAWLPVAAPA